MSSPSHWRSRRRRRCRENVIVGRRSTHYCFTGRAAIDTLRASCKTSLFDVSHGHTFRRETIVPAAGEMERVSVRTPLAIYSTGSLERQRESRIARPPTNGVEREEFGRRANG